MDKTSRIAPGPGGGERDSDPEKQSDECNHAKETVFLLFLADLKGVITSCSDAGERYGFAAANLIGHDISAFYSASQSSFPSEAINTVLERGQFEFELICRKNNGENVNARLRLTLLRGPNSAAMSIVGMAIENADEAGESLVAALGDHDVA